MKQSSFRDTISFQEIAKKIYEKKPETMYGAYNKHPVLSALHKAFCRINPGDLKCLSEIITEKDAKDCCSIIALWYQRTYKRFQETDDEKEKSGQGTNKNINFKNTFKSSKAFSTVRVKKQDGSFKNVRVNQYGKYNFDRLYRKEQFLKYMVGLKCPDLTEDFLAFLLHMAVAFLLKPDELDKLLKQCGFQQLHVRNIHHLAIYATLSKYENDPDYGCENPNPFQSVRDCYESARNILNEANTKGELKVFANDKTVWIRKHLMQSKRRLSVDNFDKIIKKYRDSFTMLHKQLLEDHRLLASIFAVDFLFDTSIYTRVRSGEESEYSLYGFIYQFCRPFSRSNKFQAELFSPVKNRDKQPTREIMILLWVYALCFASVSHVQINDSSKNRIGRYLAEHGVSDTKINECYMESMEGDTGYFNISRCIFDKTPPSKLNGNNLYEFLNQKLMIDYEWAPLNPNRPFDYYISTILKGLKADDSSSNGKITFDGVEIAYTSISSESIPPLLYVICEILKEIKKYENYPLDCRLYIQL